ncbi:MAG: twin-arginine translocation signal domain-containing protein [Planctomycetaceae bacterium]|jgi:Fe-Mn family superoxide dismutase|nr:twin-arginine translocation signal domain-containing protein [Planctomycetaceae bacterium]
MKRREFLKTTAAAGGLAVASGTVSAYSAETPAADSEIHPSLRNQPPLPYSFDALAPFLSEEQMRFHYEKHHAGYFKNLAGLVAGTSEAVKELEEIIRTSSGGLFNNAAQAWNHSFFWNCMSPDGGGKPPETLLRAITAAFGSFENFTEKLTEAAVKWFGSGWVWLATDKTGKLEILALPNAGTPVSLEKGPVLTVDVWEHAYYIDYRNERAKYVRAFMDKINWKFAGMCYEARNSVRWPVK